MQKNALLFGMSLNDFWYGHPMLFYLYRDTYLEKIKIENQIDNNNTWRLGLYVLKAFQQGLSNGFSKTHREIYPKEPFVLKEEKQETPEEKENRLLEYYSGVFKQHNMKLRDKR